MGLTVLAVDVANVARPDDTRTIEFLIDSGAIYSVVPATILDDLGVQPVKTQDFRLADGSKISRRKGVALFRFKDLVGGADVIFGEPGDSNLLGAFTLEALGLALDPLRRELHPLPMILAGWRSDSSSTER
ncbi:MAG TPA: aspartyl protease family protein [Thermoanaerobaculia bacterium]|nr:aspartyl protease family protein [Thermoanaerobaculia bacterium]